MTDNQTDQQSPEATLEQQAASPAATTAQPPATEPTDGPQETADPKTRANAEAAKYRRQLRETEGQLEAANTQLAAVRDQHLATSLPKGLTLEAVKAAGYGWDNLAGEDGSLDADKLDAAAADTRARFGITHVGPVPGLGNIPTMGAKSSSFADAFKKH